MSQELTSLSLFDTPLLPIFTFFVAFCEHLSTIVRFLSSAELDEKGQCSALRGETAKQRIHTTHVPGVKGDGWELIKERGDCLSEEDGSLSSN